MSPYKDNSTFSSLLIFPTALTHSFLMTLSSISIRKLKQLKENFHRCHHHIYSLPSICTDTVCSLFLLRWMIHASVHSQSFHLCSRSYSTSVSEGHCSSNSYLSCIINVPSYWSFPCHYLSYLKTNNKPLWPHFLYQLLLNFSALLFGKTHLKNCLPISHHIQNWTQNGSKT